MSKSLDEKTVNFFAAVTENMPALSDEQMERWVQNPKELQKNLSVLAFLTVGLVPLSQMNGVRLSSEATNLFNGVLGVICRIEYDQLTNSRSNDEIIKKNGQESVFKSVNDLEATIADLVTKDEESVRPKSELASLPFANVFYVHVNDEIHYVALDYHYERDHYGHNIIGGFWHVRSGVADNFSWNYGNRIFRNCGALDT